VKHKKIACPKADEAQLGTLLALNDRGRWVKANGKPALAFSGLTIWLWPAAWYWEHATWRHSDSDYTRCPRRKAMDKTAQRYHAANGMARPAIRVRKKKSA
jgi:hypothetical protein